MAKIRMLSEDVIGKIAAGEVVERPAAAIKELVENSLDAGAAHISVEIEQGGIHSFRVTDDGCGIEEGDLRLAFERHATSKIRTGQDLDAIGTLGFRGEALASIAAVARVTLTTRPRDRETGLRVKNEGGRITEITEAACAPGTGILVKELFYNVPVRREFLKKPVTEANAVTDLMLRLILSRPDVSFRYVSDGRTQYHSPGDGKIESTVAAIYGGRVARTLRKVEGHEKGVLIRGFVGIGENARGNRSGESFFINGRMLRSPLLSGALEDACRERVMIGKFPICALYLEMPYENVNVNVHPNKMEVRFRFDQAVREAVFSLVYDALQDRDAFEKPVDMPLTRPRAEDELPEVNSIKQAAGERITTPKAEVETGNRVPSVVLRESPAEPVYRPIPGRVRPQEVAFMPPAETLPPLELNRASGMEKSRMGSGGSMNREELPPDLPVEEPVMRDADGLGLTETVSPNLSGVRGDEIREQTRIAHPELETSTSGGGLSGEEQLTLLPEDLPRPMKIFGAVFDTFILIEYADHLLLVDQHAVHERLLFDRMMREYEHHQAGQELLVPAIVQVTRKDMSLLEEHRELLEGIGLSVEPFSENEVAVRSVPVTLGESESAAFLRDAIDELENGRFPGADRKRAAILQQACKHAVKGGEPLPEGVLRSLVEEMIEKKVTPTCPHGRPLVVSISHRELDKKFKRIQ